MASASRDPFPIFDGHNFQKWSKKAKKYLIKNNLWYLIEDGYPKPSELYNDKDREHKEKESLTLLLLQKAVPSEIELAYSSNWTAKKFWKFLQWNNEVDERSTVLKRGISTRLLSIARSENASRKREHLPTRLNPPNIEMSVTLRSTNLDKEYRMEFYGITKSLDVSAWKKFAEGHKLKEKDRLKFNVVERGLSTFVVEVSAHSS